jgi:hypothetical protein
MREADPRLNISLLPVPIDRALKRIVNRTWREAELLLRLRTIHPHGVASHSDAVERNTWIAAA